MLEMGGTTTVIGSATEDAVPGRRGSKSGTKHRSRGGCLTCKQKHVKCDETRPSCQKCGQKGLTCPGYSKGFTWSYKHQPGQRRKSRDSRRLSQSTADYERESIRDSGLVGSELAIVDDGFSPSLQSIDAMYTTNSPSLSTDLVNGFQMDISEPWQAANMFFTESVFASLSQVSGTGASPSAASAFPFISIPSADVAQSLTLPARISGGPEATEALVNGWFDQVCPAWSAFDSCLNPNRKIASELMHHSATVFDTLQYMSAGFLSSRLPQMKRPALRLLKKAATSAIAEADSIRAKEVLDTVPTALLFSLFCLGTSVCWLDAKRLGLPFLKEAKDLLHRLSWQSIPSSDDQLEMLAFFRKSLVYWEMLLSFVDDYDSTSDSESNDQISPVRDSGDMNTDLFLHPWTGISTRTSRLFARTIRLCRSYRRRVAKPTGSEIAMSAAMQEMQDAQKLEEHLMGLDFSSAAPINQTGDEKTPWLHLAYVAEAYQLASLLQLYLTFPDLVVMRLSLDSDLSLQGSEGITCDRWTIPLALRLIKLLEQIPAESGSRVIQPLLYICASTGLCYNISPLSPVANSVDDIEPSSFPTTCASMNILGYIDQMDTASDSTADNTAVREIAVEIGNARNFIMRRLDTLECTLQPRPIAVAKELVKAIWAVYDDENRGCMSGHWMDVMESKDLRSLFG